MENHLKKQWFKTKLHFVEFSEDEMTVIEYKPWNNTPSFIEQFYFPRDYKEFIKVINIQDLEPISEEEFNKMHAVGKLSNSFLIQAA